MNDAIIYFIRASLGEFDMTIMDGNNVNMNRLGEYFQIIFLLFNLILMLNLVIAILSQSFSTLA